MTTATATETEASLLRELHAAAGILRPDRTAATRRAGFAVAGLRTITPKAWSFRRLGARVGMSPSEVFRLHAHFTAHSSDPVANLDYDAPNGDPLIPWIVLAPPGDRLLVATRSQGVVDAIYERSVRIGHPVNADEPGRTVLLAPRGRRHPSAVCIFAGSDKEAAEAADEVSDRLRLAYRRRDARDGLVVMLDHISIPDIDGHRRRTARTGIRLITVGVVHP